MLDVGRGITTPNHSHHRHHGQEPEGGEGYHFWYSVFIRYREEAN